jgi:hypothetical protein
LLVVAAVAGVGLLASTAWAAAGVSIGSASVAPGGEGSVDLEATGIGDPGLGAWTLDITYDPDVVSVASCSPQQGGVCNPAFADDMIRVTGASASGLEGDTTLATITFECGDEEGSSDLDISINVLADATIGDPQPIEGTASGGSIDCEVQATSTIVPRDLGPTGAGPGSDGSDFGWPIAALAGAGLAALAGFGALRLRTRDS